MYEKFFGLKKRPFLLTPDPDFLYLSKVHDLALTHLEYGVLNNAGFIAVTGEVGSGKTTLVKTLFNKIKDRLDIAMIFTTNLDPQSLLEMLVNEFEIKPKSNRKADLFDSLVDHFIKQYSKGRRCVIIVDEAQNLPVESFEELRMLSNVEIETDYILQIILVGQPELKEKLSHPDLSQLSQRISVYFHITPLPKEEVENYINHRLMVAGYRSDTPLFTKEAIDFIAEVSKGIPRIINLICDTSLVYAFVDELKNIDLDIVKKAVEDNELLVSLGKVQQQKKEAKIDKDETERKVEEKIPLKVEINNDLLLKVQARIEALEMRIREIEESKKDSALKMLYELLIKERKRNAELERTVSVLKMKLKDYEKEILNLKKKSSSDKPKKIWRFGFGKDKN